MGSITGQQISDRAWLKVQEPTGGTATRHTAAEALLAINDGQRAIVEVLPKANPVRATPTVATGTRQSATGLGLTTAVEIIDVVRNMATDGITPGRAITLRDRSWMDESDPSWHSRTAAEAIHWFRDERDPKAFYLYPAKTSGKVEVIHSALPTDLGSLSSAITLDDIYANALQWWLLFTFYAKDTTERAQAKAASYLTLFYQSLGVRDRVPGKVAAQSAARAAGGQ